ncbi:MAG: hypothetical protein BGO10_10285 [Chlamydia sp. 32-24]|nr:MAG: hypothetical protein BGO10_10285 [Chlamydia sp. 32-24]
MKINDKILSIPPYLSTSWENVRALQFRDEVLVIHLKDSESIQIPGLTKETVEQIFHIHSEYLEHQHLDTSKKEPNLFSNPSLLSQDLSDSPVKLGFGFDAFGSPLQHNPDHMNAPDLPEVVLKKISAIAKIIAPEDIQALPKPEPHCNCMHCQIAKAINKEVQVQTDFVSESSEEEIVDEDLTFQQWNIEQTGDQLFNVTNRLDQTEQYRVYLGKPVGCTCGKEGCEHIVAVLKS